MAIKEPNEKDDSSLSVNVKRVIAAALSPGVWDEVYLLNYCPLSRLPSEHPPYSGGICTCFSSVRVGIPA